MLPVLAELDLEQLRHRMEQLDALAQAQEFHSDNLEALRAEVFSAGGTPEDDWNNYHRVRNEYDRRAAEEFDLGQ